MKTLRHLLVPLLGLCWLGTAVAGELNAWLDRTQVAEGETVQLTVEAQGQQDEPDFSPLQADFDILGRSSGSRMSIINGHTESSTSWTLQLSPKHAGTLTIPALHAGSARSDPLQLTVSNAPVAQSDSNADIQVETELSATAPYVQAQVIETVRLLYAVPLKGGQLSDPSGEHLLAQKLGDDREYTSTRNGRRYHVIERRYALFPQSSGQLELAAPVFDGEVSDPSRRRASPFSQFFGSDVFDDMMAPTRRVRVRGKPETLQVRARPAASQGAQWLPATQLALQGSWQPDGDTVHVGEPLTLQLDLQAQGLTGGQLPNIVPDKVAGFDVYPDQAQRDTDTKEDGVTGHLQQKIAFIPRQGGTLTLPALELYWWDTAADREQHVSVPGRTLQVLPAAGQAAADSSTAAPALAQTPSTGPLPADTQPAAAVAPAAQRASRSAGRWPLLSAALAAGWLLTLFAWWWRSQQWNGSRAPGGANLPEQNAAQARRRFHAACKDGDAFNARRNLLEWAAAHWREDPPRGLQALAGRIADPAVQQELAVLDRALYTGSGVWNGRALAGLLTQLPARSTAAAAHAAVLQPLYPDTTPRAGRA